MDAIITHKNDIGPVALEFNNRMFWGKFKITGYKALGIHVNLKVMVFQIVSYLRTNFWVEAHA